jgi:hypothetical protein
MTNYEFASTLYPTAGAMHRAIVSEWMRAGGMNKDDHIAGFLAERDDESLVDELLDCWDNLPATRDELLEAMAEYRASM